jgi:hypothetical protein
VYETRPLVKTRKMCRSASGATPAHASSAPAITLATNVPWPSASSSARSSVQLVTSRTRLKCGWPAAQAGVEHGDAHAAAAHAALPQRARTQRINHLRTVWLLRTAATRFDLGRLVVVLRRQVFQLHTRIAKHTPRATDARYDRVVVVVVDARFNHSKIGWKRVHRRVASHGTNPQPRRMQHASVCVQIVQSTSARVAINRIRTRIGSDVENIAALSCDRLLRHALFQITRLLDRVVPLPPLSNRVVGSFVVGGVVVVCCWSFVVVVVVVVVDDDDVVG